MLRSIWNTVWKSSSDKCCYGNQCENIQLSAISITITMKMCVEQPKRPLIVQSNIVTMKMCVEQPKRPLIVQSNIVTMKMCVEQPKRPLLVQSNIVTMEL